MSSSNLPVYLDTRSASRSGVLIPQRTLYKKHKLSLFLILIQAFLFLILAGKSMYDDAVKGLTFATCI